MEKITIHAYRFKRNLYSSEAIDVQRLSEAFEQALAVWRQSGKAKGYGLSLKGSAFSGRTKTKNNTLRDQTEHLASNHPAQC